MVAYGGARPARGASMMVLAWLFVTAGQYSRDSALGSQLGYSQPTAHDGHLSRWPRLSGDRQSVHNENTTGSEEISIENKTTL
ncbi:hypothetical protein NL676_006356 [Syzygium grande]|nr:hypothetical protein NL676_006356 [Syzygium grande]